MAGGDDSLRIRPVALLFVLAAFLLPCLSYGKDKAASRLKSFYIVREGFSDMAPFYFLYILDVAPVEDGTEVRHIRINSLNEWCAGITTVKAAVVHVKGKSPQDLVGDGNPCRMAPLKFYKTLDHFEARHGVSIDDTARWNGVAECADGERQFHFPYPEALEWEKLMKERPLVAKVWNMESHIVEEVFGEKSVFHDIPEQEDIRLQRLGKQMLPMLRSGKFDAGFSYSCRAWNYMDGILGSLSDVGTGSCATHPTEDWLKGYIGIVLNRPLTGKVLNIDEIHFQSFTPPEYPPLAQMARIQGEVVLSLKVDPKTGDVKDATAVSGHPLLTKSSLAAAKKWRFEPGAQDTHGPVRVTIKFALECGEVPVIQ